MNSELIRSLRSKWLLRYATIPIGIVLASLLTWAALKGPRGADVCAGIGLVLFIAAMMELRRTEMKADKSIAQRIKTEYAAEWQPQVFALYDRLKAKELEYLFVKVLDDAKGDLKEANKLTGLAESIGWKAFLENRW